ncbi:MAG: histone deacetylase [Candidatus Palauibacterales bacterium]|nr:histone deacetylase [Candidatus Palauibacterales bacterium]
MRAATAFLTHPDCSRHDTGPSHPENAGRLAALSAALEAREEELRGRVVSTTGRHATAEELGLAHPEDHIRLIREASERAAEVGASVALDADTIISPGSWDAAQAAAGSVLAAVDLVLDGTARNAFCAVRPPGHHATRDQAMGFCLFNNVAIGALYARRHGLPRAMIIDWDVHHGNGTEAIFYEDPDVFYVSMHQSPHYPGTGHASDRGRGDGFGTTLNVPVGPGLPPDRYVEELRSAIEAAASEFSPDIILISAGFDAAHGDPLAGLTLRPSDYHRLTRHVMSVADLSCEGRVVSVLEGGYSYEMLARCAAAHVRALAGLEPDAAD